jgi:hypothetical protein
LKRTRTSSTSPTQQDKVRSMKLFFESFGRAVTTCLHPQVLLMSLLPLLLMVLVAAAGAYFLWTDMQQWLQHGVSHWPVLTGLNGWLSGVGWSGVQNMLVAVLMLCLLTPLAVVASLLVVAIWTTPAMLDLVAQRRYPELERRCGGSFWASTANSLGCTVLAMVLLVVSIPLWFVPPLVLVLPPLIWGWLTYRVMGYDVLAEHASNQERQTLLRAHRWPLLGMGVITGYLGAVPSLAWISGILFVVLSPVLIPVALWLYTVVFGFSALWFAHYALAALRDLRQTTPALTGD